MNGLSLESTPLSNLICAECEVPLFRSPFSSRFPGERLATEPGGAGGARLNDVPSCWDSPWVTAAPTQPGGVGAWIKGLRAGGRAVQALVLDFGDAAAAAAALSGSVLHDLPHVLRAADDALGRDSADDGIGRPGAPQRPAGVLIVSLGETPTGAPPAGGDDEIPAALAVLDRLSRLVHQKGRGGVRLYDEYIAGGRVMASFAVACFDKGCSERFAMNEAELHGELFRRLGPAEVAMLQMYDAASHQRILAPSRPWQNLFCAGSGRDSRIAGCTGRLTPPLDLADPRPRRKQEHWDGDGDPEGNLFSVKKAADFVGMFTKTRLQNGSVLLYDGATSFAFTARVG